MENKTEKLDLMMFLWRLSLSLQYNDSEGRLTLGILHLRILSLQTHNSDLGTPPPVSPWPVSSILITDIYVKVTLYEGGRIIKAKKTRALPCSEVVEFNEKFSIRLPPTYLDNVSCRLSLCSRNKFGVKSLMGRTSVGSFAFANGQGWLILIITRLKNL